MPQCRSRDTRRGRSAASGSKTRGSVGHVHGGRRHPLGRPDRGGHQDQESAGRQGRRGHPTRRRASERPDPDRPDTLALPAYPTRSAISPPPSAGSTPSSCRTRCARCRTRFDDTPPQVKAAVQGVARFSDTLDRARRATASAVGQREQGDDGACRSAPTKSSPHPRHQFAAGSAADPKRGTRPDLGQRRESRPTDPRIHRRKPHDAQARARQAQRRLDYPGQPQSSTPTGHQGSQHLRYGAG